ncbi:Hypothetical protein CINCED_3A013479, partial [Cinara cedri]
SETIVNHRMPSPYNSVRRAMSSWHRRCVYDFIYFVLSYVQNLISNPKLFYTKLYSSLYGIRIWGCAAPYSIKKIQSFQSICLCIVYNTYT